MRSQYIKMADFVGNWLFDTIILYLVFLRILLKSLSLSSDSELRISSSPGKKIRAIKPHDKFGKESYQFSDFSYKIKGCIIFIRK